MVRGKVILAWLLVSGVAQAQMQDPTAPLGWAAPAAQAPSVKPVVVKVPQLHSIICVQSCQAVLNDRVVSQGDSINGYQVARITADQVTLRRGEQQWQLALFSLDIKQ